MADQLSFATKLAHNIGLIVLESQELERHLKFVVAISNHSATKSLIERHERLRNRSLGEVVKRLMGNLTVTSGRIEDLEAYFRSLLDRRNKVVHHFFEAYADDLKAERHTEILASLAALRDELQQVSRSFRSANKNILDIWLEEQSVAT